MKSNRWRGLTAMLKDAVENASVAIERIQKETANRPFSLLEKIPPIARPAKVVHEIFDASVSVTHGAIRLATRAVGKTVDVVLETVERDDKT